MSNPVNSLQIAKLDAAQPCHFAEQPKQIQGLIVTLLFADLDDKIMNGDKTRKTTVEDKQRMFAIAHVCKYTYALVHNQLIQGDPLVRWPGWLASRRARHACTRNFEPRQKVNDSPLRLRYFGVLLENGGSS